MSVWDDGAEVSSSSFKTLSPNSIHPLSYLYPTKVNPSKNSLSQPGPFSDSAISRSDPWAPTAADPVIPKSSLPSPEGKFTSCIKSVKCRFMTLGVLLGLLLSLGAIVPMAVVWQLSNSKSTTTSSSLSSSSSPSSTVAAGLTSSSLFVSTAVVNCNSGYFCEQQVIFSYNMTLTALSLTVTIQRGGNTTYSNAYTTYSTLNFTYTTTSSQLIYQFFLQSGQQLPPGNRTCAAQFNLNNQNHTSSADTYSMTTTNLYGVINSASGNF